MNINVIEHILHHVVRIHALFHDIHVM